MLTICRRARLLSLSLCLALLAPAAKAETQSEPDKATESPADPVANELRRRLGETGAGAAVKSGNQRDALSAFYAARSNALLWVGPEGLTTAAQRVIAEIRRADEWGLDPANFVVPEDGTRQRDLSFGARELVETELKLSVAVLEYARHARGGRIDPTQLSFSIDRTPPLLEPKRVLDEIAASDQPDQYLRKLHPQHTGFERLRQLYLTLRSAPSAAVAAGEEESPAGRTGKPGKKAVAAAQSEGALAQRVLLNMEQWRWMPEDLGEMFVWVNIPEFTLRVVHNGEVIHAERVITGKPENQTPIFSDEMETVVFHPSWGVPNSIKVKELLPGLLRGSDTLTRNGLRAEYRGQRVEPSTIDWVSTDIRNLHIYQPPGANNVLGVVKFLFPNKHDVYMHDTPTKNLFDAEVRAFSHGCMRVRNPLRLAEIVMAYGNGWSSEQVAQQIKSGRQNNSVELARHIPVHVTYFTATVDEAGKARYFRDIYGHERRIQMGLEGKAHLIAKKREDLGPVRAEIVSKYANSYGFGWSDTPDWLRRVFNN